MNYRIRIRNSARNLIWIRIRIRIFFWIRYSPTKWPVQKLTQGTTQKLLQHHDATDI